MADVLFIIFFALTYGRSACRADPFDSVREESYWSSAQVVEVSPGDLTYRFISAERQTGLFEWRLQSGEYQMPPHGAIINVSAEIRLLGAGKNETMLIFQGHTRMLMLMPGSSVTIVNATLAGITDGYFVATTPTDTVPDLYPRFYVYNAEWWAPTDDIQSSEPAGYLLNLLELHQQNGIVQLLSVRGFQQDSAIELNRHYITFPGRFLLRTFTAGFGIGAMHLYYENVTQRESPGHEMEGLFNMLVQMNGLSHTDCWNGNPEDVGFTYRGNASKTKTGYDCLAWDDPRTYPTVYIPQVPGRFTSTEQNYCRSPRFWPQGPWCFTSNPNIPTGPSPGWELCDIPMCPGTGNQTLQAEGSHSPRALIGGIAGAVAGACVLAAGVWKCRSSFEVSIRKTSKPKVNFDSYGKPQSLRGSGRAGPVERVSEDMKVAPGAAVHVSLGGGERPTQADAKECSWLARNNTFAAPCVAKLTEDEASQSAVLPSLPASMRVFLSSSQQPGSASAPVGGEDSGAPSLSIMTGGNLHTSDPVEKLTQQLNTMHRQGTLLARRYKLLGPLEQRSGGQGVVRFATLATNPTKQFAIKFFVDRRNFDCEERLYSDPAIVGLLAPTEDITSNEHEPPVLGSPLPPMIVTERGESLSEYASRRKPDFFMCLPIVGHLAQRTAKLHCAGLAHRDIKPGNVIWLPSENGFTLIDFGSTARIGTEASISCTLAYAAPEVIRAYIAGASRMLVSSAVDVWSLGLLFYEFLTGSRLLECGQRGIIAAAMQHDCYPWEQVETLQHAADMRRIGLLRPLILAMLERDPASRISMADFNSRLKSLMQHETTTT